MSLRFLWLGALAACAFVGQAADPFLAPLPEGVQAIWDTGQASREVTPTRERICLNGLWRWQPTDARSEQVPAANWGYFKVPGSWPGITDYMQKDSQRVFTHASWRTLPLRNIAAGWYQREFTVPDDWSQRRISVRVEYLNSFAVVFLDGQRAGEISFPGGELEITRMCQPGPKHLLSVQVAALPLKGVMLSYTDSASARQVEGTVARRGLCGDVYLISTPPGPRIAEIKLTTSVRQRQFTFETALDSLAPDAVYSLQARVVKGGRTAKEFSTRMFRGDGLTHGRIAFTEKWMPENLWDIHTPENIYEVQLSLLDAAGKVLDTAWPVRFGFREFWIDGRDFYLNGSRIFLSGVPLDNAQVSAAAASYEGACESLRRLKNFGINFVYTHNYGCQPGSHLSFAEILRAADDVGMLVGFSQPHFSHYDWQSRNADADNGYLRHARYYTAAAGNHPSVVMYSMSHNATGYGEDMNPDLIDGIHAPRENWGLRNSKMALRAEAIVQRLDASRVIYHHASGNLGSMHSINFYPNFVPIQELSDWFEHWAKEGVKPVFTCEYGAPFVWDWTMYRGWYKGEREFGSAKVPWEFCMAEWNAQFFGDPAFRISEAEKENLRWEARQFRAGNVWHRWDYPNVVSSTRFDEQYPVFAMYITDNWRAFRTWGVSANSPWQHQYFWKLREGVDKRRQEFQVDWANLQRPGFSPDYVEQRYERMDLAFERADWNATPAARALLRNNQPLLAYVGGKPARFTSKDHNFFPGETIEKQLIVINNSRETVSCDCHWSFDLPAAATGDLRITIATGQQERIALRFELPTSVPPGKYELAARFTFSNGEVQQDSFFVDILPAPNIPQPNAVIALFDPKGETADLLRRLQVPFQLVDAAANLSTYEVFAVGKAALSVDGAAPDIRRVRDGLKVFVFEQTSDVLEKRFGFRVTEYGARQVFRRVPDHPALAGLSEDHLRDWRGEATILPSRLKYELRPRYGPTVQWCGLPVTRLWRCGNRGNVASVLIEKPARGDFLPIVDTGYSLQYSPLLEYREGEGMVLFCQLDVTGRTETDPASDILAKNLLEHVSRWKPSPRRRVVYAGEPAGKRHFEAAGISVTDYNRAELRPDEVLVLGPGAGKSLRQNREAMAASLKAGAHLLAVGLDQADATALLPFKIEIKQGEHIASFFEAPERDSLLAGVGPADVHNRDPRELPLVSSGANIIGNGVLAMAKDAKVVFCQMAPWRFSGTQQMNLKRTHRRASFLVSRLLANMGVAGSTPLLERFHEPVGFASWKKRWLDGLYLDQPEEWDDPYRFFRW